MVKAGFSQVFPVEVQGHTEGELVLLHRFNQHIWDLLVGRLKHLAGCHGELPRLEEVAHQRARAVSDDVMIFVFEDSSEYFRIARLRRKKSFVKARFLGLSILL